MKECIYTPTHVKNKMGRPAYNVSAFPCHEADVKLIWLNGSYPEIESLCENNGIEVKPLSEMKPTKKGKPDG